MKILCESMLYPTTSNWRDLLFIAESLDLTRLKLEVLVFLRDHLDILGSYDHEVYDQLNKEFPGLMSTVLAMRCKSTPAPPSMKFIEYINGMKKQEMEARNHVPVPWIPFLGIIGFAYIYSHAVRVVVLGPYIPVMNAGFIVAVIYFGYNMVSNRTSK